MQHFCFLLKQFFGNVKKKIYGWGVLEKVGRVTVNTTFFFFAFSKNFGFHRTDEENGEQENFKHLVTKELAKEMGNTDDTVE